MRAVELHMPATPKAVPELRHRLRGYDYDVRLCATELLTNVVEHVGGGTPVRVAIVDLSGPDRARIEVTDPDPRGMPTVLSAAETAECGRGLVLVAALAERWGVERGPGGKTVWCEVVRGRGAADFGKVVPRTHRHQDAEPDGEPGDLHRVVVDSVAE
ncbi:ATP-binding protein [Streptomyces sp. NPDC093018]|uniref:ATP-binding protein n=1 Tax=Streptomyces sp. NPDC093018 TaxID=3155067 RepID=UPI00341321FE